jgi:hypothetical protein|nr:MAG TPA: hypothetical protein [Caudoviricetes sp.]
MSDWKECVTCGDDVHIERWNATQPQEDNMNGYKCFYKGKTCEVYANSSYEAQQKAAQVFKAKKSYEVTVVLCEVQGAQVTHAADF